MNLRKMSLKKIIFWLYKISILSILGIFIHFYYTQTQLNYISPKSNIFTEKNSVNEENKHHQYCEKEAHNERVNEVWDFINSKTSYDTKDDPFTEAVLNKYYTACIERRTLQPSECYKRFNQTYYDHGFDPEIYANVRADRVKYCAAKTEAKFVCNRSMSRNIEIAKDIVKKCTAKTAAEFCNKLMSNYADLGGHEKVIEQNAKKDFEKD